MVLNGRNDVNFSKLNSETLDEGQHGWTPRQLTILSPPHGEFTLSIVVQIKPQNNTILEGFCKITGAFCTQYSLHSFRDVAFFPDGPDVLTKFIDNIKH